jgi:Icc protein
MRILQITDSHLRAGEGSTLLGVDTAASLRAVLAQALSEHRPDAVIASGDLAHDGEPEAYRRFRVILESVFRGPVLHLAGNHDLTAPMGALLRPAELRLGEWHVIGFDSHVDHRTEAGLDDAERAELEARMASSDARFLLVTCHHPPVAVGCPWLDKDCIPRGGELLESLAAHPRVKGLVFGHVHQEVTAEFRHLAILGTPSTCFQFQPRSERFAVDRSADTGRPGYRWLELQTDGRLASRVRRLEGYALNIDTSDRS